LTLLETIKRTEATCPVILCTGFANGVSRALGSGADAVFTKPVEPAAIARRIRELLGPSSGASAV
jgi:DNA-binding response OmpR family regulator